MISKETLTRIKADWQRILGPDGKGSGAICPKCGSGSGPHGTGISPVPETDFELKCMACGECHDVFGWVAIKLGLDIQQDFKQIVEFCSPGVEFDKPVEKPKAKPNAFKRDFPAFFNECSARISDTDYWTKRGFTIDTCRHFDIGFDPAFRHAKASPKAPTTPRLIVPISDHCFLARDVRDHVPAIEQKYTKLKEGKVELFNAAGLNHPVVFAVEGEFDAMSIWQCGFENVVGIGSIAYVNKFTAAIRAMKVRPGVVILALDNEDSPSVKQARDKCTETLNKLGVAVLDGRALSADCKDPNELLVKDPDRLAARCKDAMQAAFAVKPIETKKNKPKLNQSLEGTVRAKSVLPDAPLDLLIPDPYVLTEEGIFVGEIAAARAPIFPVGIVTHHNSREQKIKLAFKLLDGSWDYIIADAAAVADKNAIVKLVNRGIMTCSGERAKALVEYLIDVRAANTDLLEHLEEFDQPGWNSDMNAFRLPDSAGCYMPRLEHVLSTAGDAKKWWARAAEVRSNPYARLMLAASFSAPLLSILGQRTFGLFLHGASKSGKTASQKFAISAWGNPKNMMANFNATLNGLEAAAIRSNDLPLLVDEFTQASRPDIFKNIAYLFSGEQSKPRMDKNLNQRPMHSWRMTVMMSGEHAMFTDAAKEGAMSRIIEIALPIGERIFDSEDKAASVHAFVERNHGMGGREYLCQLMSNHKEEYGAIKKYYKALRLRLQEFEPKYLTEHMRIMSAILTADILLTKWFFKLDALADIFVPSEGMFVDDTMTNLFEKILPALPTAEQMREETRAWRVLILELYMRQQNFCGLHLVFDESAKLLSPIIGEKKWRKEKGEMVLDEVMINCKYVEKILSDAGFNPSKMIKAFRANGWVKTDSDGKLVKRASESNEKNPKAKVRMFVIAADKFVPEFD